MGENFVSVVWNAWVEIRLKQLHYISIRPFSKIRILNWGTGYLGSILTASIPLEATSSDHFKDLHKVRLLKKFHDNLTSPVKVVPKLNQYFAVASAFRTHLHYQGFGLKFVEARINLQLFAFEYKPSFDQTHCILSLRWKQNFPCFTFKNTLC